jgi:hypothetical protein
LRLQRLSYTILAPGVAGQEWIFRSVELSETTRSPTGSDAAAWAPFHITKGDLEKIEIPLPPLDVQKEIVAVGSGERWSRAVPACSR